MRDALNVAAYLMQRYRVVALTIADIEFGHQLITHHNFSMWDSLIVASALNASCTTLYSEDMQHGQIVHGTLTILNPFL